MPSESETKQPEQNLVIDLTKKAKSKNNIDMQNVLGYLDQAEWTKKLTISQFMQLKPIKLDQLLIEGKNELQLTRDSFIEKTSSLAVAYFCYSTEIRFIL